MFEAIAARGDAETVHRNGHIGLLRPAGAFRRGWRPRLVSAEQLPERWVAYAAARTRPTAVCIYDDAVAQSRALGIPLPDDEARARAARLRYNHEAFAVSVVPTASFAQLIGLEAARVVVGGNGTDVRTVVPGPWPVRPTVGFASGAAPGRGIERLIEAMRLVRDQVRDAGLLLWLVTTSPSSEAYLEGLRREVAAEPWLEIRTARYGRLGAELAEATILAIPHPPGDYFDVALPVKLFDSLAAGRPLVVTPRTETAAVVEAGGAGLVAGDAPPELATAVVRLLEDDALARRLGAAARATAVAQYDWPVVSAAIARSVLARVG